MSKKTPNMSEIDERLSVTIGKMRTERGETMAAAADAIGVPLQTYQHWEACTRKIKAEYLLKIAEHFNVSTDYLLGSAPARSKNPNVQVAMEYTGLSENVIDQLHSIATGPRQAQKIQYLNDFFEDLNTNDFVSTLEKLHCACYAAHFFKLAESSTFFINMHNRIKYTDAEICTINANKLIETAKYYEEDNPMLSEMLLFIAKNLQLDEKSALFSSAVLMPEDIFKNNLQKLFTFAVEEYCSRGHITEPSAQDLENLGLNKTTYYVPSKALSSLFHYPQNETEAVEDG